MSISKDRKDTSSELIRPDIWKYHRSGKPVAIHVDPSLQKRTTKLELNSTMTRIEKVNSVAYVKSDALEGTPYQLECIYTKRPIDRESIQTNYQFIRILTQEDLRPERWDPAVPIENLPVSPTSFLTREEKTWAGQEDGNLGSGLLLSACAIGSWWWAISEEFWFPALIALPLTYYLVKFPWSLPKSPNESRLARLRERKEALMRNAAVDRKEVIEEFSNLLSEFENWASLSPKEFEIALQVKLGEQGLNVKATRYSGDGGIDLEGTDKSGQRVIIQAKKYKGKVGVAVVREMIGVREAEGNQVRTIIYSLMGFTKGAAELGRKHGIELRDIRSDVLGLKA